MSDSTEYQVPRLMRSVTELETRVAELERKVALLVEYISQPAVWHSDFSREIMEKLGS